MKGVPVGLRTDVRELLYRLAGRWFDPTIVGMSGIEFARPGGVPLQLNLWLPRTHGEQPAVARPAALCIHGGGFCQGHRDSWNWFCRVLARQGYVAATCSYRLAPEHPYPAAIDDVRAALAWLADHAVEYQVDPARLAAIGDSAGGLLAQWLAMPRSDQPAPAACVVSLYGPCDLARSYGQSVDAPVSLPKFLGGDLTTAAERHRAASPLHAVTANTSPMLLVHGTRDRYVAADQSRWLHERLRAMGVDSQLVLLEGAAHTLSAREWKHAQAAVLAFLERQFGPRETDG